MKSVNLAFLVKSKQVFAVLLSAVLLEIGMGYLARPIDIFIIFLFVFSLAAYRWAVIALLLPLFLIVAVYFPVGLVYGSPNVGIVASLIETNPREALDFIQALPLLPPLGVRGAAPVVGLPDMLQRRHSSPPGHLPFLGLQRTVDRYRWYKSG